MSQPKKKTDKEHWIMRVVRTAKESMEGWTPGQRESMRKAAENRQNTFIRKTYDEVP